MKKLATILALFAFPVFADTPAVKMSNTGICHNEGSQYYGRVKSFTAYDTIAACLAAGGRLPR
jgi:hypothetical protein